MSMLAQSVVFLCAAVIAVPVSKRLGLGSVLGYLGAGIVIGPYGLRLISGVDEILHFAELGVVLLLFIIGLELQPRRLWALRKAVFGLGGAQVLITAGLLFAAVYWFMDIPMNTAIVIGLGLALSSTAFALQTLAEKHQLTTRYGRSAFAILLFQDLAVIPIIALLPLLVLGGEEAPAVDPWIKTAKIVAVLLGVIVGGHYLLRHALRIVAATNIHEIFTASALLTVVGVALLMEQVGLSMALGAFLAGVLLAESEFRHELEADIAPFKGLLLGLFFIAVGMWVDIGLILSKPVLVLGLVVALVALKLAVLYLLGRVYGLDNESARKLAISISQGGEFAFVIFTMAVGLKVMDGDLADLLVVVVTISMAVTPLLFTVEELVLDKHRAADDEHKYDQPEDEENPVIIAGLGRVGQIVARVLRAKRIGFTALDASAEQVALVRRFGNKAYYGDASRLDLLRAAGGEKSRIFVLAIADVDVSLRTVQMVHKHFPNLTIYARARDRMHAHLLMEEGVRIILRETYLSSLEMSRLILQGLGRSKTDSEATVEMFREHDERRLEEHHESHKDQERFIYLSQKAEQELEELLNEDTEDTLS